MADLIYFVIFWTGWYADSIDDVNGTVRGSPVNLFSSFTFSRVGYALKRRLAGMTI